MFKGKTILFVKRNFNVNTHINNLVLIISVVFHVVAFNFFNVLNDYSFILRLPSGFKNIFK